MGDKKYEKRVLAIDIGASGGRAILGTYTKEVLKMKEVHRFPNEPVIVRGILYWDVLRLFHEIKESMRKAQDYGGFDSIGIDTWGVDFGLIDEEGRLMENPVHYRDKRTQTMIEESREEMEPESLYQITGNQVMPINTYYQLMFLHKHRPDLLAKASHLLLMPDLFNYFLSGVAVTEYSIASTTQLMDVKKKEWSRKLEKVLGLPDKLLTPIIPTGSVVGQVSKDLCQELGIPESKVIAVAGHDTQSAFMSVPNHEENFIVISCGTWALFGTQLEKPLVTEESWRWNMTNEGGYEGKITFLKNITGLWLIQESRRQWTYQGQNYSFGELEHMAEMEKPFQSFIDPNWPEFSEPGNMPDKIKDYCRRTGQNIPQNVGQIVRCIDESLAMAYYREMKHLRLCTHQSYENIYIVGGGVQSRLLCQMTSNACGCQVTAGPVEATALGNLLIQLMTEGTIETYQEAKSVIEKSQELNHYLPHKRSSWEEAYKKFEEVALC